MRTESASVPLLIRIEYEWSRGSQSDEKRGQKYRSGMEFLPTKVRISSLLSFTGCADSGVDADGDKSDAHCICSLGVRNNMNIDSRHTDSNGRTDARSTRRDNNSGTSENRSIRSEIQN